ncbi:MAG: DUF4215 domain-containing protein [Bradymonadia bacterium]
MLALLWGCTDPHSAPTPDAGFDAALDLDGGLDAGRSSLQVVPMADGPLLLGVWHDGASIWLAGGRSGDTGGVLLTGGDTLTQAPIPPGPPLWWVWGTGEQRFASGEGGRIVRFDGARWLAEPTGLPDMAVLWGIWGSGPEDLWAVGGSPRPDGPKGVILRSTGDGQWERVDHPALPTTSNLYKVWGTGPNDVHIVGEAGVALHWDGADYRRIDTGTDAILFTVHGQPEGPIFAVGGTASGVALQWSGDRWIDAGLPEGLPPLNGVFVAEDGVVYVTGQRNRIARRDLEGEWSTVMFDGRRESADTLHAVWGRAPGEIWVVGGDFFGGNGGVLITDRAPRPTLDFTPPPQPDAGLPDMDLPDVEPPDSEPLDFALPDVEIPDMGLPDLDLPDADGPPICGDERVQGDETCDDGNRQIGDGCDADCQLECGNGRLDPGEACEDGNRDPGDGCDAECRRECGNGRIDGDEACDDGNREPNDGCDRFCRLECGNAQLDGDETCDDGNTEPDDGCDEACRLECGNGQLDGDEACDDGNTEPGDGCDAQCEVERLPGPGEICPDLVCAEPFECWGVADLNFTNYCLKPCEVVTDCIDDFGPEVCCQPPGPQLLDTFCVPQALLQDPCGE